MSVYCVPAVQPVEYPDFLALRDGRFSETLDDWLIAQSVLRRDLVAGGHHVIGVYVGPADLRRYCRAMNCPPDAAALNALATRIGQERFERYDRYETARAQTVIVETSADRRAALENGATPVAVEEVVPRRRRWWAFWQRPRHSRLSDRTAPLITT